MSRSQTEVSCFKCGIEIVMADDLYEQRLKDHESFWCPNGHRQHFTGKTEVQKLQNQLAVMKADKNFYADCSIEWHDSYKSEVRRRTGCQGMIKRLQNLVAAQNRLLDMVGSAAVANAKLRLSVRDGSHV